jgi:hypothetical protein
MGHGASWGIEVPASATNADRDRLYKISYTASNLSRSARPLHALIACEHAVFPGIATDQKVGGSNPSGCAGV